MNEPIAEAVTKACMAGDVSALNSLVDEFGPDSVRLDQDPDELTALHWAAASGNTDAVQFLLSPALKSDPCAVRGNNFAPLHSAAMQGHDAVCEVLIAAGADVNVQTQPQKYAPLHSAAFAGHIQAIRVLLSHGADRELLNYRNEKPSDTARRTGQMEAAQLLES